ncbi:rho GDP-dissociation inhibitor 1-like protein [Cinnamomum micranthum f. kanehirae]|uniref:Rho GDP-dissociation inhibitor 1-like protein n=1 Tax=Cinnamomum micranthum f. kanehirae TaxID=337451 RepID=A0A443Q0M7_9MAGN|nr:rho GDP-dissociation inhibitor 1-like protein [Cinnamomum micranthum f. kanehirae]
MMDSGGLEAGPSASWAGREMTGEEGNDASEKKEEKGDEVLGVEDHEEEDGDHDGFVPGPLIPLKEQLEKDKDDESLRRWKEKLLGCVEGDLNGQMEPEVVFHSVGIITEDRAEITTPLPINENQSPVLFTLKEGTKYSLKLTFSVRHNIVSGLTYCNTVWKAGHQVDQSKGMLGTFAPQRDPYTHTLEEETTPSGLLARGIYSAKLKFEDDDKRCHLELNYSFEIKKRS